MFLLFVNDKPVMLFNTLQDATQYRVMLEKLRFQVRVIEVPIFNGDK